MKKLLAFFLVPASIFAQDVKVNGNSSNPEVFKSTNTSGATQDRQAVTGLSTPLPNWGIGVHGEGGYMGVRGWANVAGGGSRFGLYGIGSGGTGTNYGTYSYAYGDGTTEKYGVYGYAAGSSGTKYGVYGSTEAGGTSYGVYCNGNGAYTGSWTKISDSRTKKNIQDYSGALSKVMALNVKKYDFKRDEYPSMNLKSASEVGVIAQEVEKVLPDLVQDVAAPVPASPSKKDAVQAPTVMLKGVDYVGLVPILLQAIKEQQAQIDALKKKIGG
jgi:hypothetical protein